jgi:hypothetical protein
MATRRRIKMWVHRMPKHIKKRAIENFGGSDRLDKKVYSIAEVYWWFRIHSIGTIDRRYWRKKKVEAYAEQRRNSIQSNY